MNKITKKIFSTVIWTVLLGAVFGLGFFIGQTNIPSVEKVSGLSNKELGQDIGIDFSLFWDAWQVIEKNYVGRTNLDRQKMVYGAITGLVNSLKDPHSFFMEPQESKRFLDDISGSFGGIGAEVGIRNDTLTVVSPLEGSPAQAAGLKPGDKVLKIDDTLSSDLTLDQSVEAIRGEPGTKVRLLILRDDWKEAKEITIVRADIKIPIIKWEIKDNHIAYIQLYQFTENAGTEFQKIIKEIKKSNIKGIVLDLRNNPGGYLEVAVDIASQFLPKGDLVVVEDFGNGEKSNKYYSEGYQGVQSLPLVILINEGSASASEILAGALHDNRGIKVIGEKSFGKGSVQQLENLRGGSSVKITVAKWLTPSGATIEGEGITPDIEVKLSEDDINNMKDPQLDKAIEIVKELTR
ncbi:MAG: hypothetical protein AUJ11_02845 [Parcubacteria group bacterium CG1_02_44_65]|uniref:S41 family peptidase n=3 Tax=Candidatus Portnoyibacteriota TaxID=1817913 RepID=A0A2M7YKS1_9BACT|nr:MAG: hypothetical protein AUJ11_02845 [Parcubacteria group bacterium CG1_02_44_65]PIZ70026.1 MAG: S41 family peptidase [Candidatus Portnoybacteria bacterium CG_4_10_14_0_2_um_filter_43_36]PJA63532.1 MAG: S41 family peptidase [Candidatus Portnoybacteria bacterium CG_4_9_14_3_um_filter_43_11]PJE59263.1 MAG: S41 family peptidase [Candidatus Portnoybacteria bacterium CG10_big_fil_rev_8_21_14_0_10_43_39]